MKRIVRTSETDPLEIATVAADAAKGAISSGSEIGRASCRERV